MRTQKEKLDLRDILLCKLRELGADCAGIAPVSSLRDGPSETLFPKMKDHSRDHFADEITTGLPHGRVFWEEDAASVLVYAVAHPAEKPEMDWWCGEIDPPGNRLLLKISREFKAWMKKAYPDIHVYGKRYHVERGGLYLKDAAVAAGLGCIGRNNLLVTPEYGPRIRLRGIVISELLPSDGPLLFDPCRTCSAPCLRHCPQNAFSKVIYTEEETGQSFLPGRDGHYDRAVCSIQMKKDEDDALPGLMPEVSDKPDVIIKYCRNCELYCRVGMHK